MVILNERDLEPNICLTMVGKKLGFEKNIQSQMQEMLAVVTDSECKINIYVSETHKNNSQVITHLEKYKMMYILENETEQLKYVDIKAIQSIYSLKSSVYSSDDTSHIERSIINLIQTAASRKVSDIHITVGAANTVIQFRKFKRLHHYKEELRNVGYELIQTMYNTMTDVADPMFKSTEPQDAVINNPAYLTKNLNGVRVSVVPTTEGWNTVLRLLYQTTKGEVNSLEQLGYSESQLNTIRKIKAKSSGILIISGPTGSGKSTTLKVVLEEIARENGCQDDGTGSEINIMTVEDPSEYKILGAKQLAVSGAETDEERLEQYHKFLKSLLRQDPDVLMIGEIRDVISGKASIKSAMSGHFCLTTIHTNDALGILDRLIEIGLEPANVLNSGVITGLVAQRLVPILCQYCALSLEEVKDNYNPARLERLNNIYSDDLMGIKIRSLEGCSYCENLGITGVTVLAEIVPTDRKLMKLYKDGKTDEAYYYWRNNLNGKTLIEHGIEKIKQGICDPKDVEAELDELFIENLEITL